MIKLKTLDNVNTDKLIPGKAILIKDYGKESSISIVFLSKREMRCRGSEELFCLYGVNLENNEIVEITYQFLDEWSWDVNKATLTAEQVSALNIKLHKVFLCQSFFSEDKESIYDTAKQFRFIEKVPTINFLKMALGHAVSNESLELIRAKLITDVVSALECRLDISPNGLFIERYANHSMQYLGVELEAFYNSDYCCYDLRPV